MRSFEDWFFDNILKIAVVVGVLFWGSVVAFTFVLVSEVQDKGLKEVVNEIWEGPNQ